MTLGVILKQTKHFMVVMSVIYSPNKHMSYELIPHSKIDCSQIFTNESPTIFILQSSNSAMICLLIWQVIKSCANTGVSIFFANVCICCFRYLRPCLLHNKFCIGTITCRDTMPVQNNFFSKLKATSQIMNCHGFFLQQLRRAKKI